MLPRKITYIGFGLMAGSLAKAFKKIYPEIVQYGVSRTMAPLETAVQDAVLTKAFNHLCDEVIDVDIIFLCTPIKAMYKYLDELQFKVRKNCIITDIGSTKSELINYIENMNKPLRFIGGHPMTGAEKTGYDSATAHLYENAYYIMTPTKFSDEESISILTTLIKKIGALPILMNANEHDLVTASISHVPHIVASALVNLVKETDTKDNLMHSLAAGGFRDVTRIASSSPEMWASILLSNQTLISDVLNKYIYKLQTMCKYINENNEEELLNFFITARNYRDSLPIREKGLIESTYVLVIDIADKPGIIGEITTILGNHNLNIKNINISNSRIDEPGVLKITFSTVENLLLSFEILKDLGYTVSKNK